ncbi:MAG: hypothetical protein HYY31_03395 [Chloroflexi bacterium]|nr:hypothetical protein [Chloroflexota bacterium]
MSTDSPGVSKDEVEVLARIAGLKLDAGQLDALALEASELLNRLAPLGDVNLEDTEPSFIGPLL